MVHCHSEVESETTFQTTAINSTPEVADRRFVAVLDSRVTNEEAMPTSVNSSLDGLFACEKHSSSSMINSVTEDAPEKCIKCSRTSSCVNHENNTSLITELNNCSANSGKVLMTDIENVYLSAELDTKLEEIELFSVSDDFFLSKSFTVGKGKEMFSFFLCVCV
ncbi:uncharacterized protein TNIN_210861 [Trichonephila inaurata madagascariensis]|uniref:Uncharacterized protein n=1 Tax=Trichonephila inaurata madagascariensis TaxID=2747483 RepID=A0A8X6WUT4_9ARAC|nr:uncharacterized protein TNIN_210861 [Trichonephila inaurata madagascariensis]